VINPLVSGKSSPAFGVAFDEPLLLLSFIIGLQNVAGSYELNFLAYNKHWV
jgi:hypothetical protein